MTKICPACGCEKARTAFRKRPERGPDAVRSKCADCEDRIRREQRRSAPLAERERALEVARQWKRNNPERVKAQKAVWNAANPDRVYWHQANPEARARQAAFREANRETLRARVLASKRKKLDYYREQQRQIQKRDAHKYRAKYKEYMATKRGATPPWFDKVLVEEAYHLAQLRTRATGFQWHVDHVVPLQSPIVCGLHTIENLQVIPGVLNLSKSNRFWPGMPGEENR